MGRAGVCERSVSSTGSGRVRTRWEDGGLGARLDLQPGAGDADDGGVDVHGADGQVEDGVADGGGLADAHAGAEHELHEVGQVEPGRCRVGGEAGLQVAQPRRRSGPAPGGAGSRWVGSRGPGCG